MSPYSSDDITVVIPTYGRDQVLVDTIRACLSEPQPPASVVVIDQTPKHDAETAAVLRAWQHEGKIVWDRPRIASQPMAMNRGLQLVRTPLVLFLDDDIEPQPGFVAAHAASYVDEAVWAVVGQIIQPWQQPADVRPGGVREGLTADFEFPFHSMHPMSEIRNLMSGHVSVRVEQALYIGGFDENYKGAAYRFDTDFGRRIIKAGGQVKFDPKASIKHLRVARGGTRIQGDHLASASPHHGQGDYYFAMVHGGRGEALRYCLGRMFREVRTKFHLKHPWYIPVKLLGEVRAWAWAAQLRRQGPALLPPNPGAFAATPVDDRNPDRLVEHTQR